MKYTKGIFLTLLCASLFFLSSCSKDDDSDGGSTSGNLVGTWNLESYEYEGTGTSVVNGQTNVTPFDGEAREIDSEIDFNADGTFDSRGSFIVDLKVEFGGKTYTIPSVIEDFAGSGTYVRNGNKIVTTNTMGQMQDMTITKLTDREMSIDFDVTTTTNQNGATTTYEIEGDYTFTRK